VKLHWPVPPPSDFNEGQRALYGCLAAGAGIFCGACSIAMISLLMWGGFSTDEEHTIVVIFGYSLGGFILAMSAVIVGLMVGGPVGRFKVSASIRDGVGLDAGGHNEVQTITKTTTETATAPKDAPPLP
jgi:hypothetical protein